MSAAHFNGLDLLAILVLLGILAVIWAPRRRCCDSSGCTHTATVAMKRHTGQLTWRCQGCKDRMHAMGWVQ